MTSQSCVTFTVTTGQPHISTIMALTRFVCDSNWIGY